MKSVYQTVLIQTRSNEMLKGVEKEQPWMLGMYLLS